MGRLRKQLGIKYLVEKKGGKQMRNEERKGGSSAWAG